MNDDYLKKQLDTLWDKVQHRLDPVEGKGELSGQFESAQNEIQIAALNNVRARFEKEKSYWESLLESKEEKLEVLQAELAREQEHSASLKNKIEEHNQQQGHILQQTFSTLEMQRRSSQAHAEQLRSELEFSRKEILDLKLKLREESEVQESLRKNWEERQKQWDKERDEKEEEVNHVRKDLYERRQQELEEVSRLEQNIRDLQAQINANENNYETEKRALNDKVSEKELQLVKLEEELSNLRQMLDKEKEERRLAVVERERQMMQAEEDRKRMVEQLLNREEKIGELQESLEQVIVEREQAETALKNREEQIVLKDEELRKRREDWVESIKTQSAQQLNISGKVVDLLNRLEWKSHVPPNPQTVGPAFTSGAKLSKEERPALGGGMSLEQKPKYLFKWMGQFKSAKAGIILVLSGLLLFSGALIVWNIKDNNSNLVKAQKLLHEGNGMFSAGDLESALTSLEEAYRLDRKNSIIKNSLTMVLGEVANKEFRNGDLESALKRTGLLNELLPDDQDVIHLHNKILKAIAQRDGK